MGFNLKIVGGTSNLELAYVVFNVERVMIIICCSDIGVDDIQNLFFVILLLMNICDGE